MFSKPLGFHLVLDAGGCVAENTLVQLCASPVSRDYQVGDGPRDAWGTHNGKNAAAGALANLGAYGAEIIGIGGSGRG